jgi:hypothetical protein
MFIDTRIIFYLPFLILDVIRILKDILCVNFEINDFYSLSFLIVASHYKLTDKNFSTDGEKFNKMFESILENVYKLEHFCNDIIKSLKILQETPYSKFLKHTLNNENDVQHLPIKDKLTEEDFNKWLNENPNSRVLMRKIFTDICQETGNIENENVDDLKKRLDDLARFLENDSCMCVAIFLHSGIVYIAVNKKRNFTDFKQLCDQLFQFFKNLKKGIIDDINEKECSINYIKKAYENNSKTSDSKNTNSLIKNYYEEFNTNLNSFVGEDSLPDKEIRIKCKLFVRFKNFLKSVSSSNELVDCLKDIKIEYLPNKENLHCELVIYEHIRQNKLDMQLKLNYIAISKLCCPLCYFILLKMKINTRGCHQIVYYWSVPHVYKDMSNLNVLHGLLFTKNFEISGYQKDMYKTLQYLPILFKYLESNNCPIPIISFKAYKNQSLYAKLNIN